MRHQVFQPAGRSYPGPVHTASAYAPPVQTGRREMRARRAEQLTAAALLRC